jgi:hypothetical protein
MLADGGEILRQVSELLALNLGHAVLGRLDVVWDQ